MVEWEGKLPRFPVALQRLVIPPEQFEASHIQLTAAQQHYLCRVLRLSAQQQFIALDGQGGQWIVALTENLRRAALVKQISPSGGGADLPTITLAIAIPKGTGFDDLVRQTTELGVTALQPLITDRTLHRPSVKKLERWRRIATEATEQAERLRLPTIGEPLPWDRFMAQAAVAPTNQERRFLCVARPSAPPLLTCLQQLAQPRETAITIATGPEGGWTPAEIAQARGAGFCPVSLGATILRAVTAPLAALAVTMAVLDHSRGQPFRSDSQ
jgi:16S rRNA (uracil1498-N3)-methyltransferase